MRAAVVTAFDRPLTVEERPTPEPGVGEILVRMEAVEAGDIDARVVFDFRSPV